MHLRHFFHIFSDLHFVTFSRYRKNAAEEDSTHKSLNLGFQAENKMETRNKYYIRWLYLSLWRDFALFLILGLRSVHAVLLSFVPSDPLLRPEPVEENIQWHPAFIIRDINSCRKGYSKGRLKSRESYHFNIQIAFLKFHHKHPAILNLDVEKSVVTPF